MATHLCRRSRRPHRDQLKWLLSMLFAALEASHTSYTNITRKVVVPTSEVGPSTARLHPGATVPEPLSKGTERNQALRIVTIRLVIDPGLPQTLTIRTTANAPSRFGILCACYILNRSITKVAVITAAIIETHVPTTTATTRVGTDIAPVPAKG